MADRPVALGELAGRCPPAHLAAVSAAVEAGLLVRVDDVEVIRLGPRGELLLAVADGAVFVCDQADAIPRARLQPPVAGEWLYSQSFGIAVASPAGRLDVWTGPDPSAWRSYTGFAGKAMAWLELPGRSLVVAGTDRGELVIWRADSPDPVHLASLPAAVCTVISPLHGDLLIAGSRNRIIALSLNNFELVAAVNEQSSCFLGLEVSSDGHTLATEYGYGWWTTWNLPSGRQRFAYEPMTGDDDDGIRMNLTPDGRLVTVASLSSPDAIRVYEADDGTRVATLPSAGIQYEITTDGHFLVDLDYDDFRIWDLRSFELHHERSEYRGNSPTALSLSGDGKIAAISGAGTTLQLVEIETGQVILTATACRLSLDYWPDLLATRPGEAPTGLRAQVEADRACLHAADPLAALLDAWLEIVT